MLRPVRPGQRRPSEEDGSDPVSELGLEQVTDRFGFFLNDGSTDGERRGPSPALVRQREAKWITIIDQWDQLLHKKATKVKLQCEKGIPASLRAKCWPLLCGATERVKQETDLYKLLDAQPALKHWEDVIERDLDRQFPFHEMFVSRDGHGQRSLYQVLKAYAQFKPEEGYCQAQGPVAAVLLMNMPAEEAFWCLVQICEKYLPGYYSPLLEGVLFDASILMWVLKRSCPAAHKHLQHHGVEPLMFATDWLMCLYSRHLPFNTLLRVWDLFFCKASGPGVLVLLQVAVVMVQRVLGREEHRKRCCGQLETLQALRDIKNEVTDEEEDFIVEVLSVPLSARDLQKQTEKELQRWQKDRPSSTFDPRGRCLRYHMASIGSQQRNEECESTEKEKGNSSLFRSASSLSLSVPKWQKGAKANSSERKGNVKVVRHLSMGAKEDCRNWAALSDEKRESLKDSGFVFTEKKRHNDLSLKSKTKETGLLEESEPLLAEARAVPPVIVQTEQSKERSRCSDDSSKQEEKTEGGLSPTATDTHVQSNTQHRVKSLKLLAAQSVGCTELNCKNEKHKTPEANLDLGRLSQCHFSTSSTGAELKLDQTPPEMEQRNATEQVNVDATQIETHSQNGDRGEVTPGFSNNIQATSQCMAIEALEGEMAGQTTAGSVDSKIISDETERSTHRERPPAVHLETEGDASLDITEQDAPERERQSHASQTKTSRDSFQQIEYDFAKTNQLSSFRLPNDFRVRKSSSSRGSKPARRLSEDLFTTPQLPQQSISNCSSEVKADVNTPSPDISETEKADTQMEIRRFSLFRRRDQKTKKQSKSKLVVPTILIQDYSDNAEIGNVGATKKVTLREKRRRRKEQKLIEKEAKRQREKEKELSERGQRDVQNGDDSAASSPRHESKYADTYF